MFILTGFLCLTGIGLFPCALARLARTRSPASVSVLSACASEATTVVSKLYGAVEPMLACFNYFQYQTLKDAWSIMGLNRLQNIMIVTVPTYHHISDCLTVEDAEPTVRYNVLRNIKDPKAVDHIHRYVT